MLVLSLALLVGLVLFFESRDDSTLDMGAVGTPAVAWEPVSIPLAAG